MANTLGTIFPGTIVPIMLSNSNLAMNHRITLEQRLQVAVGLLKSAIIAPPDEKEAHIRAALLNLTSAEKAAPAEDAAYDDFEVNLPDAQAQVRQLIKQALDAPSPEGLAHFLEFAANLRRLSTWNAYMAYIQRPGASVIASEYEWKCSGRFIKADAVPIIVLWPRSPIRFVYELADTGPNIERAALKDSFSVHGELHPKAVAVLQAALMKQKAFRIEIELRRHGFKYAGSAARQGTVPVEFPPAESMSDGRRLAEFVREHAITTRGDTISVAEDGVKRRVPSYRVTVNDRLDHREGFATITHELGHIFCGHLGGCDSWGTDDEGGWPNRASLPRHEQEIEAEAVAYIVCSRGGLFPSSAQYLKAHAAKADIRLVNLDLIVRSVARIERLAKIRHGSIVFQEKKRR